MDKPSLNDHPIHDLARQRWSPRAFSPKPVEEAALHRLFEAARWAPSCFNEQPWELYVATSGTPERHRQFASLLNPFNHQWAAPAPVLMVAAARAHFTRNGDPNMHAGYDLGQAIAWLTVQATAEGLRMHQIGGFDKAEAARFLNCPSGTRPYAMIALGHPVDPSTLTEEQLEREMAPRVRRPLTAFVHGGQHGKPF